MLVADNLDTSTVNIELIQRLEKDDMRCLVWEMLLAQSEKQWQEFFEALKERSPDDERLAAIAAE